MCKGRALYVGLDPKIRRIKKNLRMWVPTVKQFYIKAEKGRDFLAPFSHDLACKVSCVIRYFVFGRNISDVFAYAKVMLLTSFVMMLLPLVAMM